MTDIRKKLLHYTGKAIADFNMIQTGDTVLVCVSGGKDSLVLVDLLRYLEVHSNFKFKIHALMIDQGIQGWDDSSVTQWLQDKEISFDVLRKNTFPIVKEKIKTGKSYCSFCSRLRRGIIYRYAKEHHFIKVALGHHRDDLIETVLMSMFYSGAIRSMPPKLITNDRKHIVLRPMVYCQEKDIRCYVKQYDLPVMAENLCEGKATVKRESIKALIEQLAVENPKVPSNILHAIQNVHLSQLADRTLWEFKQLEDKLELD